MASTEFTNILVATDGSASSQRSVELGLELAGDGDGRVTFLHVVPPVQWRVTRLESSPRTLRQPVGDDPVLAEAEQTARAKGIEAHLDRVAGDEVTAILAVAEDIGADLIVLGRGRRRPKLHGVTKAVVRRSPRSVFVAGDRAA